MKKLLFGSAAAALMIAVAPAVAQPAPPPPGVAQGTAPAPPVPPSAPRMHMRNMSERVLTREDVIEHVRKLFARLDTNHDGFLSKEELGALHRQMIGIHGDSQARFEEHGMVMADRAAMFDRLDANHDGVISRQEFMAAHPPLYEHHAMVFHRGAEGASGMRMHSMGTGMVEHLLEMADSNHDGRISLEEAEAAALAHFDRADLNHDGKITPEERQQMRQLRHGEHQPG